MDKMNNFQFIIDYKNYGRRNLLKEDELDDALGLTDVGVDDPNQQSNEPAAPEQSNVEPTPTDNTAKEPASSQVPPELPTDTGETKKKDDVVELDVSTLVLKQEEMNQNITAILAKIQGLMQNNANTKNEVSNQVENMKQQYEKDMNELKKEIQKRNPTPIEQIQLRSMSSFPYNIKLSDFWQATDQDKYKYAVANAKTSPDESFSVKVENKEGEEYILKTSDIQSGNDTNIKNSF